jgi:predicted TIM-barrel fold metal-dependent hydrolase
MADYKIFSADSHVSEPGDLWVKRIDKEFSVRAPRMEQRERNGRIEDVFVYEGFPPHPVGVGLGAASRTGPGTSNFRDEQKGYSDALTGGWDPVQRLKDQDVDGVEGEILHTTLGFRLYWMSDPKLKAACFRAYNDWLSEFCSHSPDRLVGVPLISLDDVSDGLAELRRSGKLVGMRGGMIGLSPAPGCPPYSSPVYDPFWAEAQEMDVPLVLHEITGGGYESKLSASAYWREDWSLSNLIRPHEVQRTLGVLILSGVFERFPRLKIISAENGTDWLPWFVGRLRRTRGQSYPTNLSMEPIEYFKRNVSFTYINEQHIVQNRDVVGVDNLMFATDYPHSASTWPRSQEIVERDMTSYNCSEEERRQLIHDNVLRIFDIKAPVLV